MHVCCPIVTSLFVHFCTNVSYKFIHLLAEAYGGFHEALALAAVLFSFGEPEPADGADSETLPISSVLEDSSQSNCKVKTVTSQKVQHKMLIVLCTLHIN